MTLDESECVRDQRLLNADQQGYVSLPEETTRTVDDSGSESPACQRPRQTIGIPDVNDRDDQFHPPTKPLTAGRSLGDHALVESPRPVRCATSRTIRSSTAAASSLPSTTNHDDSASAANAR